MELVSEMKEKLLFMWATLSEFLGTYHCNNKETNYLVVGVLMRLPQSCSLQIKHCEAMYFLLSKQITEELHNCIAIVVVGVVLEVIFVHFFMASFSFSVQVVLLAVLKFVSLTQQNTSKRSYN